MGAEYTTKPLPVCEAGACDAVGGAAELRIYATPAAQPYLPVRRDTEGRKVTRGNISYATIAPV